MVDKALYGIVWYCMVGMAWCIILGSVRPDEGSLGVTGRAPWLAGVGPGALVGTHKVFSYSPLR